MADSAYVADSASVADTGAPRGAAAGKGASVFCSIALDSSEYGFLCLRGVLDELSLSLSSPPSTRVMDEDPLGALTQSPRQSSARSACIPLLCVHDLENNMGVSTLRYWATALFACGSHTNTSGF